ncbi:MAG: amino acid permease [Candidatus Micrarchaeota archaeon]|nr:amino acid permease [Candidatus Micrarchaeota archaeon]
MGEETKVSKYAATAVGLGAIIGAGIFVLSGTAIALAGPEALIAFILVGIVAMIVAFELGELGSIMPGSKGSSYSFVYKAFGSEIGFVTGILLYFSLSTSISVISLGFGAYMAGLLGLTTQMSHILIAIGLIFVLAIVNLLGIRKAANADMVLVIIKIGVLLAFIGFSMLLLFGGRTSSSNFALNPSTSGIAPIFAASIAIFFAYSGFQAISSFTSRIRGGSKAAARAILYSVVISMVLYVLVTFSLMIMAPASSFKISGDPLSTALQYAHAPQWLNLLVVFGALVATTSASLAMMLGASRLLYQLSADHLLPGYLRRFNRKSDVAVNGVIISAVIGAVMLFSGNIYTIAAISNFGLLFSYLMSGLAVMHFRRKGVMSEVRMPLYPYLTIVATIMLIAFIYGMPQIAITVGISMALGLFVFYYMMREAKDKKVIRIKLFR